MRPQKPVDRVAFVLLLIGAFSWGYFVTDVNILDVTLERMWDSLNDLMFVLIALSGLYWLVRVFTSERLGSEFDERRITRGSHRTSAVHARIHRRAQPHDREPLRRAKSAGPPDG